MPPRRGHQIQAALLWDQYGIKLLIEHHPFGVECEPTELLDEAWALDPRRVEGHCHCPQTGELRRMAFQGFEKGACNSLASEIESVVASSHSLDIGSYEFNMVITKNYPQMPREESTLPTHREQPAQEAPPPPASIPGSLEALKELTWKEFENLAIWTVNALYKETGLIFRHTLYSHDGGRDGEAEFILGIGLDPSLQQAFRVWIEVKMRAKRNIGKSDIGSHLVDASRKHAHSVIFVTNKKFSRTLDDWIADFALRTGLQYTLIDGERVLELANRSAQSESPSMSPETSEPESSPGDPPRVTITAWFSLSPFDSRPIAVRGRQVFARADRPVFLHFDTQAESLQKPTSASIDLGAYQRDIGAEIQRYGVQPNPIHLLTTGSRARDVFAIWPGPKAPDTRLSLEMLGGEHGATDLNVVNKFQLPALSLPSVPLAGQRTASNELTELLQNWRRSGGLRFVVLRSGPGQGKSKLTAHTRNRLLTQGVREYYFDGERFRTDRDLVREFFAQLLPVAEDFLNQRLESSIRRWCEDLGVGSLAAAAAAKELCRGGASLTSELSVAHRGEILCALLAQSSLKAPVAVVIEDLHKCSPSLLALLSEVVVALRQTSDSSVFILASTRPLPSASGDLRYEWLMELQELLGTEVCRVLDIAPATARDAHQLIEGAIPSIEDHQRETLIRAVGSSPFAIREALLFLLQKEILISTELTQPGLAVADPSQLRLVLADHSLRQATARRLDLLLENLGEPARVLLCGGASYGRQFPIKPVAAAAGTKDEPSLDRIIDACSAWSVLSSLSQSANVAEFDHDLVREAAFCVCSERRRRLTAASILDKITEDLPAQVECRLAYVAGDAKRCLSIAQASATTALSAGRAMDVLEANQFSLQVLDPDLAAGLLATLDPTGENYLAEPVLRQVSQPTTLGMVQTDRWAACLEVLLGNLDALASVGSGSSATTEAALTEARMLAVKLEQDSILPKLAYYEGRMWHERDDPIRAAGLHEEAERSFEAAGIKRSSSKAENLVRLAICYRHQNRFDDSIRTLFRALRARNACDPTLANKVRNNVGASYLLRDWELVRYHWTKQLHHAERNELPQRTVHALASLSFVDLFEGRIEKGRERAERALALAEEYGFDNQRVRLCLNLAVHAIMIDSLERARLFLLDAERTAVRHNIGRRLWRVVANLATIYELRGDLEATLARDVQTTRFLVARPTESLIIAELKGIGGRHMLPLLNILLRAESLPESPLYTGLVAQIRKTPTANKLDGYRTLVSNGRQRELPNLLGNYCVSLPVGPRFLLTE